MALLQEGFWRDLGYDAYMARAATFQGRMIDREYEQPVDISGRPYNSSGVRQAIVHTRQDMILLVSLLHDLNRQVRWTRRILGVMVILLVPLVWATIG